MLTNGKNILSSLLIVLCLVLFSNTAMAVATWSTSGLKVGIIQYDGRFGSFLIRNTNTVDWGISDCPNTLYLKIEKSQADFDEMFFIFNMAKANDFSVRVLSEVGGVCVVAGGGAYSIYSPNYLLYE